ncbi:MAG TPA: methionyl-tRNA formyltransferase [Trueperaceae bacterium]|nr:methionyl-tRNA formyltransferase [Trueperaceae bacterium]
MRVALFASPAFALKTLEELNNNHELVLVVSQQDKPVGRGMKMRSPVVAERAKELGLRLEQPQKLRKNYDFFKIIEDLDIDVAITAAYGKILPQQLLDIPKHGFLNIHGSLLPKYRGAAPIQWAILNGEHETGISIMQTEAGLDTGPIRLVDKLKIEPNDTAISLFNKLAKLGSQSIIKALDLLAKEQLPLIPQDDSQASHAPMLKKEDGEIRWSETAQAVYDRYRALIAWPKTQTIINNKILKIHDMQISKQSGKAGQIIAIDKDGVTVACGQDAILLKTVQAPSKAKMPAFDWANGYQIKVGDEFGK